MKKSPWLAIRETFADTPDYTRRTPVAKRCKYAPISAGPTKKTPQFRTSYQNESSSSKTTPLSTRHPTSRFKFSSHKRATKLTEIIDDDVENVTKLHQSSPPRRKDSQPLLSICNTPEAKDRLAIDDSSCESVNFDPDYDDYHIDTILTAKSSNNPLKCISTYRRAASTRRLSSVCSNLSGRFVQHPESPGSIVLDSDANTESTTQIIVPDSQANKWCTSTVTTSSNTTIIQNSQVIEAFETEPTDATQSSIEFQIDEASEQNNFSQIQAVTSTEDQAKIWSNSSTIPCSQSSSSEELAVSPNTVIETLSSADTLPTVKPIGMGYTKQKKPRRPIKGGFLEELINYKHKAQSEYNFWHNMRRAGVAGVPYTVMMVTGVEEQSYGRVLVYAEHSKGGSDAEGCRALFTFDRNMQFCSRLKEGVQFEVNLSDATGYSLKNGVIAYPAVQEVLFI